MQAESYNLTKKEFEKLIENECKARLGVSLKEYLKKRGNGGLPNKPLAIHNIELLLKFAHK